MRNTLRKVGSALLVTLAAAAAAACKDDDGSPGPAAADASGASTVSFYRVLLRGKLRATAGAGATANLAASKALHDKLATAEHTAPNAASEVSHATFLNVADATDWLGIDTWSNLDDLKKFYADPAVQQAWGPLLDAPPTAEIWEHPTEWVEWGALTPAVLKTPVFLFRIRNRLSAGATEDSRTTHNRVAGGTSQQKAISLGDQAHTVHLRTDDPHELLFLDVWLDAAKAQQQFFADPETQKGGAELFVGAPDVVVFNLTDWYQW